MQNLQKSLSSQLSGVAQKAQAAAANALDTVSHQTAQLAKHAKDAKPFLEPGRRDPLDSDGPGQYVPPDPDGPIIIRYFVPNGDDKDSEGAVFALPGQLSGGEVTLGLVRSKFPLVGNFHFRFQQLQPDNDFGGFIWVDLCDEYDRVPFYRGQISMKALKLPDDVIVDRPAYHHATPSASRNMPQSAPSAPSRPQQVPSVPQTPFAVEGGLPADLMELDKPKPRVEPQLPANFVRAEEMDRSELVRKREEEKNRRMQEKLQEKQDRDAKESSALNEKLEASGRLAEELDNWAKNKDGTGYKDIKTLLCTMHEVIWQGSNWQQVPLSELMVNPEAKVKKFYRKGVLIAHPDKHQSASGEQQYRAERIFNALNEAFKASSS